MAVKGQNQPERQCGRRKKKNWLSAAQCLGPVWPGLFSSFFLLLKNSKEGKNCV
jgi:hypothetical protein